MTAHRTIGRVLELHRYPVKSLAGERLEGAEVDRRGVAGDRLWSVRDPDGRLGSGKTSRRFRRMDGLLRLAGSYAAAGGGPAGWDEPRVAFPDGRVLSPGEELDAALSAHVGRPVALAREAEVSHFDDGPVHLVTTSGLRALAAAYGREVDAGHFRANLLLDTGDAPEHPEDGWLGRELEAGGVVLRVTGPMPRCVMVEMAQVGVPEAPGLLRTVTAAHDGDFGVLAEVVRPGRVAVGDPARLLP
jgi:uncharacterized protein YcbX